MILNILVMKSISGAQRVVQTTLTLKGYLSWIEILFIYLVKKKTFFLSLSRLATPFHYFKKNINFKTVTFFFFLTFYIISIIFYYYSTNKNKNKLFHISIQKKLRTSFYFKSHQSEAFRLLGLIISLHPPSVFLVCEFLLHA